MTYDEFKKNFLPEFLNIKSFNGKINYANQYLQRIGSGTGRIVYDIDGEKVLKLARNSKGVAQNETETGAGYYEENHGIVAIVFDSPEDDSWLIAEKAKKVNEARIKQLTSIPSLSDLFDFLRNYEETSRGRDKILPQDPEIEEFFWNENEFAYALADFIANYNQKAGDMGRPSSYGEVIRYGQPTIVLTDYGLNDEVYDTHYSPKKDKYQMYEMFNCADGNDDILSDMPPQDAIDTRQGMWAQMPYGVGDGDGVINEDFISFVLARNKYPSKLPSAPYILDEFHNIVNNLKEVLKHVPQKKKFYNNLLSLQEWLIKQKLYDRDPLLKEEYEINEGGSKPAVQPFSLEDKNYAVELASAFAKKINLGVEPVYLDGGSNGHAFTINNDVILKITADKSEADAAGKLINEEPKHISKIYSFYKIIDTVKQLAFFAILQENVQDKPTAEFHENMNNINKIKPMEMDFVDILMKMRKAQPQEMVEIAKHIMTDTSEANNEGREAAYDYLIDLISIQEELYKFGIKSDDYGNPNNLGYQNGVLKFFDIGGYRTPEPTMVAQDIVYLPEDGSAKFSSDTAIGQDEFPVHNNIDNSPSIQNDLNANINIEEDLDYNYVVGDATQDEYMMSERKLSSMEGSSTVEVKQKCRLAGNGNTSTACNQGDINNLNIKPLKEEISAKEAYTDQGAIKTVLNGKRNLGFVHLNKPIAQKLEKYKIGVIPVRMTSQNTMTAIIYRDKVKAYLLYEIIKRNGGYLKDKTPEEAREIGNLLEYKSSDIEEFIRKVYGNKVPVMPDRSPDDFDDLAEEVSMNFWDLNENNIEDSIDMTTLNRGVSKDEPISVNDFPLNKLTVSKRGISASIQDINQGEPSTTNEPVQVFYNIEKQTFLVEDGYHRVAQAYLNKEKMIPVSIYSDNYSDYIANISPENKFELPEGVADASAEKQFDIQQPHQDFEDKFARDQQEDVVFTNPNTDLVIIRNPKKLDSIFGNTRGVIDPEGNLYIEQRPNGIHLDMLYELDKLGFIKNNDYWDTVLPEDFVTVQRYLRSNKILLGESNFAMKPDNERPTDSQVWSRIPSYEKAEPIYQRFLDRAKEKTPIFEFINEPLQRYEKNPENHSELTEDNLELEENHSEFQKNIKQDLTTHQLDKKFIRNYQDGEHTYSVFAVNGDQIRDSGFIEWVDGGNHWVDADKPKNEQKYAKHIPENDFWVDDVFMVKPDDFEAILLHERTESFIIRHYGYEYDDAHEISNKIEMMFRKNMPNGANRAVAEKIYDTFVKNFKPVKSKEKHEPINESINEMLNEAQIMGLNYLPFREDVEEAGGKIYSVGGAVRDEFLGKESKDLDILITGVPFEELEQILGKYGAVNAVGKSFGVLKFKPKGATEDIDIAIPRTETPTGEGGHQGFDVKSDHTLPIEKDLERRDFTINAIAKDIGGNIIDPFGGQEDLKNKIIKVVNSQAFSDDPLRMLRAVQFASRFNFTIEPETLKMIRENAGRVKEIAPERILTEFDKIVKKGNILTGAILLDETGLLKEIFGRGLYYDFRNTKEPFDKVRTMGEFVYLLSKNLVDEPAEFYKSNLKGEENAYREIKALQIAFDSSEATNLIEARSVAHNMYVISPTSLQSQILPNVIKTAAQELLQGKYPKTVNELTANGNDLMQAGLQGKAIGDMQKSLLLKVYANKVMNNKEELLSLAGENKSMIKEFAYPELRPEEKEIWDINGEQVDISFFVEKYDIWNQGEYSDPSEASVFEFIEKNYEDLTHDEKLKKELLQALTDRNVLDETVINEMSIQGMDYTEVITPEYIKQVEMSDNFERFIAYYKYEYNLINSDDEEIENTKEFKNWFVYELRARYGDAVDKITDKIKPDGTIDIWRRITVDDEENRWINHLADAGKHLGIYWSWDERAAEAHWGNAARHNDALIKSSIKEEYIDWKNTLYANMDMSLGEDEKEITLFKNTSLKIEELYIDDEEVMTSGFASAIKIKTFYA